MEYQKVEYQNMSKNEPDENWLVISQPILCHVNKDSLLKPQLTTYPQQFYLGNLRRSLELAKSAPWL